MDEKRVRGSLHEVEGVAKQVIGKAIGNRSLVAEGHAERIAGRLQRTLGVMNEALRHVMKKF
jgi:uncharacterized protein YjbJ (UPF0337 family)